MTPARRPLLAALLAFFVVAGKPVKPAAGLTVPALPWLAAPARLAAPFAVPAAALRPSPVPDLPPGRAVGDTITLSPEEAQRIGRLIWRNESAGSVDGLTHWNEGEDFASLGIAHFIWYPSGKSGPFTESFPMLLAFMLAQGAGMPQWLQDARGCPWPDRAAFDADFRSDRMQELRGYLAATVDLQARFAAHRLEGALPRILAAASPAERPALRARFYAVAGSPTGVYALVDYVNFKGEGVNPTERYAGQGWGLLQVLELSADAAPGQPSVEAFEKGADAALTRRVANAPAGRRELEQGWLPGWRARLKTYLEP
ncbi:MAG: hypothetical protein KGL53_03570 [Elusimicrobia bacterium]|nr:hypothetical protein [Elusimicrobiota bacterium]